ncbi:penicillin binding protein [Lentzea atacamensis]|uniref:Penicillin binding protein n=1 Tax=Lentzea atacamensis TaxID=531938 RepID=A0A316ILL3_9PSEU|nr:penicillin-binding transpeptidase domain-containing protein [Lentzea atacamensis]PWK91288.1 penicillin binding protein [Lentzea atacamensis]
MRRSLIALLLVAGVVGYVVWQRPDPPAAPPPPRKEVVVQYADGSRLWSSTSGRPRTLLVKRVLAELAEASLSYDSLQVSGAVVRTSIDAKAQTVAATVLGRLVAPQRELDAAVTAMDPASGAVRVYLPGFRYTNDMVSEVQKEPGPGLLLADGGRNSLKEPATPLKVNATYAALAAGGVQRKPHLVTEVTAADGSTRYRAAEAGEQAFSKEFADQVTTRLKGNPACNGMACAPSAYTSPAEPRKTKHAWVAGYTPELAVTVWVGQTEVPYDDGLPEANVDADLPRVIWQEFLAG